MTGPLDITRPLFVRRDSLTLNGRVYTRGERLELDAVSHRKLVQLYDVRIVGHDVPAIATEPAKPSKATRRR